MKRAGLAAAGLLLAAAACAAWLRGIDDIGFDFAHLWAGGRIHRTPLYEGARGEALGGGYLARAAAAQQSQHLQGVVDLRAGLRRDRGGEWLAAFVSTPFLYTLFAALPPRYDAAWMLYQLLSIAASIAAVLMLARDAGVGRAAAMLIAALLLLVAQPLQANEVVGNVNGIQLFTIALYVRMIARGRSVAAGALLGAAIAFKPNVAFILPLAVANALGARDWRRAARELGGALAGLAVAVLASSALFGSLSCWTAWLRVARSLSASRPTLDAGNLALPMATAIGIVAAVVALIAAWQARTWPPPLLAGLGAVVYLLGANTVWSHYLLLALPAGIALLAPGNAGWMRVAAVVALSFLALDPWTMLLRITTAAAEQRLAIAGLAILYVAGVARLAPMLNLRPSRELEHRTE